MNYYEFHEFIRDHAGKTPDEVYKQGAWKVAKNGGAGPVAVVPKPKQKQKTVVLKPKADPYAALREYLREQHNVVVPVSKKITPEKFPWLARTETGKVALYGDHALHDRLKLGDAYRVVTTKTGIFHKAYDPAKVQPKFFKTHETSVVGSY